MQKKGRLFSVLALVALLFLVPSHSGADTKGLKKQPKETIKEDHQLCGRCGCCQHMDACYSGCKKMKSPEEQEDVLKACANRSSKKLDTVCQAFAEEKDLLMESCADACDRSKKKNVRVIVLPDATEDDH